MKTTFDFFLEGYAYLDGIEHQQDKTFVYLRRLEWSASDQRATDDWTLKCEVMKPALFSILQKLETKRLAGYIVLLQFRMVCPAFGSYFAGIVSEDPKHMLELQGKLQEIRSFFLATP